MKELVTLDEWGEYLVACARELRMRQPPDPDEYEKLMALLAKPVGEL